MRVWKFGSVFLIIAGLCVSGAVVKSARHNNHGSNRVALKGRQQAKDDNYPPVTKMSPDEIKNSTDPTIAVGSYDQFFAAMNNGHITHIYIANNFGHEDANGKSENACGEPEIPTRKNLTIDGEINSSNDHPKNDSQVAGPTIDMGGTAFSIDETAVDGTPQEKEQPKININNLNVFDGDYFGLLSNVNENRGSIATYHNYSFTGGQPFVDYGGLLALDGKIRINQVHSYVSPINGQTNNSIEDGGQQIDESSALWIKDKTDLRQTDSAPAIDPVWEVGDLSGMVWDSDSIPKTINPNTGQPFGMGQLAIGNNVNVNMSDKVRKDANGGDTGIGAKTVGFCLGRATEPNSFSIGNHTKMNILMSPNHIALTSYNLDYPSINGGITSGNSQINIDSTGNAPSQKNKKLGNNDLGEAMISADGNISFNADHEQPNEATLNIKQGVGTGTNNETQVLHSSYGNIDLSKLAYTNLALNGYLERYKHAENLPDPFLGLSKTGQVKFPGGTLIDVWNNQTPNDDKSMPTATYKIGSLGTVIPWPMESALFNPSFNPNQISRIEFGAGAVTENGTIKFTHSFNNAADDENSKQINGTVTDSNGSPVPNAYVSIKGDKNIVPNKPGNDIIPNDGHPFGDDSHAPAGIKNANFVAKTDNNGNFTYKMPLIDGQQTRLAASEVISGQAVANHGPGAWFETNLINSTVANMGNDPVINPYKPKAAPGSEVTGKNNPANNNAPVLLRLDAVPKNIQFQGSPKDALSISKNNSLSLPASVGGTSLADNPSGVNPGVFTQFTNHNNEITDWNLSVSASTDKDSNNLLNNASLNLGNDAKQWGILQELSGGNWQPVQSGSVSTLLPFNSGNVPVVSSRNVKNGTSSGVFQIFWNLNEINLNIPASDLMKQRIGLNGRNNSSNGTVTWNLSHGPQQG